MAPNEFLLEVLRVLMPSRYPPSIMVGGTETYQDAFPVPHKENMFFRLDRHVVLAAHQDTRALREAGFSVEIEQPLMGLLNAFVAREGQEHINLQWVNAGSWNFFDPVSDPDFGCRLHMADLAINKALATGGRRQVRDYLNLFLIHKFILPLWAVLWAAPGKDKWWSPHSLVEKIALKGSFRQEDFDEEFGSGNEISAALVGTTIRDALEEADSVFQQLPKHTAGRLFVSAQGGLIMDIDAIKARPREVRALAAVKGCTWPSGPEIDHALLQRVIDALRCDSNDTRPGYDPLGCFPGF